MSKIKSRIYGRLTAMLILLMAGWAPQALAVAIDPPITISDFQSAFRFAAIDSDGAETIYEKPTDNVENVKSAAADVYGVSFDFDNGGSTATRYWLADNGFRTYGNTKITLYSERLLNNVVFKQSNKSYYTSAEKLSASVGTLEFADNGDVIWTAPDSKTSDVTFTVISGQFRFKELEVTYDSETGSGSATPVTAPLITPSTRTFTEAFTATIENRDSRECQLYYTLDGTDPDPKSATLYTGTGINIPEGADMTLKAIALCDDGVSKVASATYSFRKTYTLTFKTNRPSGVEWSLWNVSTTDGRNNDFRIAEGEEVNIYLYLNSGYKLNALTVDGTTMDVSSYSYLDFTMPGHDVVVDLDVAYDPSSPGNPMPTPPVKTYKVTYVYNPVGAGGTREEDGYSTGDIVRLSYSLHSNYRFINYVVDGMAIQPDNGSYYVNIADKDVVVTVNAVYNPTNPDDPTVPALTHPLTTVAVPTGSCDFYVTPGNSVVNGGSYTVTAYPAEGYVFKGWKLNGVPVEDQTSTRFTGVMTEQGAVLTAICAYNPVSPSNPGANSYNDLTGMMIVDDFTPGYLYNAVSATLGNRGFDAVTSLIVKGKVNKSDFSCLEYMSTLQSVDLSRTSGAGAISANTFENLPLTSVILPADITSVGNRAFNGCSNLASLSVHAVAPPTVTGSTFSGFTPAGCVLRVPEESIELYKAAEGWKDFAEIAPLGDAVHVLEVQLPHAYWDGRLKNNNIELINLSTGRRQKYVITERPVYTFNGVMKDEQYLVRMMSETGLEMARIENVTIPDADFTVAFTSIKEMVPVSAKVVSPEGDDVTEGCTVEWFEINKDDSRVFLRKAAALGKVPEGQNLECRVTMGRDLSLKYTNPGVAVLTATPGNGELTVSLAALRAVVVSGRVVNEEGTPLSTATVNIRQQIAGKYDKSAVAKVGKDGTWCGVMLDAPLTVVTYSAPECVNRVDTVTPDMSTGSFDLGDVEMRSSVGARIAFSLSFRKAVKKGEESVRENDYADRDNLTFKVYNETKGRQHQINVQNNTLLVLEPDLDPADILTVSLSSNTGDFLPVEKTVAVGENFRPEVSFDLVGKGGVTASYGSTDSPAVSGMLYGSDGKYIKRATFNGNTLDFNGLDAGDYTLVAMTRSDILNAAANLDALDEIGLKGDKDYVSKKFSVAQGIISEVEFKTVPSVDESLYTFTGNSTSLTPNRNSVTSGQYLTIRSMVDFKPIYRSRVSDVTMEFTIPEGADFVDASMMKGSNKFGYDRVGNKVVVDFGGNYAEQLRFCVIPTRPGNIEVTGRVSFKLDGQTVSQPIGAAAALVKDFEFSAPTRTCYNEITVSGSAAPDSKVAVMQDGVMIGESQSGRGGSWTVNCTLVDTYHQSEHQLQAVVTTPDGVTLTSGTRRIVFDGNAVMIDRVTMLTGSEEVVFDFNGVGNTQSYTWVDDRLFTFIVKLSENAPEKISDVILYVKQLDGETKYFNCYYSKSRDAWLCVGNFTSSTAPVNVAVSVINAEGLVFDRGHFDEQYAEKAKHIADGKRQQEEFAAIKSTNAEQTAKGEAYKATLKEITTSFDGYDDTQMKEAVAKVLAGIGMEAPSYEYDETLLGNADEIERLMNESLRHLLPVETPDYTEFDAMMKKMDEDDKDLTEWSEDFEFDVRDTDLDIETVLGNATYSEVPYAEIDLSKYADDEIMTVNMNDGSLVKIVMSGNTWIILDQTSGKAWKMTLDESVTVDIRRAKGDLMAQLTKWVEKAKTAYDNIKLFIDTVTVKLETEFNILLKEVTDLDKTVKQFELANEQLGGRLKDLDVDLEALRKQAVLGGPDEFRIRRQISQLEESRKSIVRCIEKNTDKLFEAGERLGKKNMQYYLKKAALEEVTGVMDIVWRFSKIVDWGTHGFIDYNKWTAFINSILPCENDQERAKSLVSIAETHRDTAVNGYIGALSLTAASGAMSTALMLMSKNPATAIATRVINIFADWLAGWVYEKGKNLYDDTRNTSRANLNDCKKIRYSLACHKDEDPNDPMNKPDDDLPGDPDGSNRTEAGNGAEKRVVIDPAGYVYEGVHSNRVEGVQATAYYREEVEDMYGDKHLNEVLWNAEEYAQRNPLFTDAQGMYAWDVPPGEWRVKFEKDGYNTTFSEWLPVPPPQLEVNVEITQNAQPEVKEVHAYSEGVDITFDKYMDPETLTTSNIFVTAGGDRLAGSIELLNSESTDATGLDETARKLVSKIRFVPEQKLSVTTGKVRLTISREVKSYANIPMTETYTQELDVEKEVKEITVGDDLVKVLYGGDKTLTVSVLPSEAGMGRTLRVANSSPLVTTAAEEIQLNELGQGELRLTGDMPGSAMLTFSIDRSERTGEVKVNVLEELVEAEKPTASRASGSALYRGEKVELKSESKGAVIYFTTDGSDPTDADGARRKYSVPVVLDKDLQLKAVAEVDGEQSETSDFSYTLRRSAMDFRPLAGWNWISHNFETAVKPTDIAADNVKAIMSQTDEVVADPKLGLVGTLKELDATHSYKVEAEGTATAKRVETYAFNPATPIRLEAGWNWLGYPVEQEMAVGEALSHGDFSAEDIIVGQDGAAQYDGTQWTGTLSTLKPGAGYMLHTGGEVELVYNNTAVSNARSRYAAGVPYKAPWAADSRKYAKAMVIVAEVIDAYGAPADDDQWYVGAFKGSECRGVGRWIGGKVMMNVFGKTGDEITLRLVNAESEKEVEMKQTLHFDETVVGSVLNPYTINVDAANGTTCAGTLADDSVAIIDGQLMAAPCDALEVFDAAGVKIISISGYDGSPIPLDAYVKGVNVVSLRNGENYSYAKIMVK